ncbi:MAG: PBP1A family penicillin-binding protein [Tyzzerella sp.]|nr:PBP1A family penicillin-binding protein [Tyzzerella sp.]
MNYGKKTTSRRCRTIQSKALMKKKRMGVRFFKAFLVGCLFVVALGIAGGALLFKKIIDDTPQITADTIKPSAFTTTAYADDGETIIDTFVAAGSNREYATIEEIPDILEDAFIAVEDSRFREHNGIDLKGIVRAGVVGLTSGDFSQGASTITQQLIKNSVFPNFVQETRWEKVERKIQEWYLAVQIEKIVDKDEILENYLNTINLGQNTLGVQAASKRYFGKDVSELTLAEAATIAGITKSPNGYNPISNPEANQKRREKVLGDMLEQKMISQAEYDEAMADNVYERIQLVNAEYTESQAANSYFIDEVAKQVQEDLVSELGYTESQAYNAVYSGGLKIITTQNIEMQQICEEEINDDDNYPSNIKWGVSCAITITHEDGTQKHYDHNGLNGYVTSNYPEYGKYGTTFSSKEKANKMIEEYIETLKTSVNDTVQTRITLFAQPQASVVVMDQATGYVKAVVGGRGEKTESMSLNRATQSTRQPGSCFKVLSTFVPALDSFGDTLATVIVDEPFNYADGTPVNNHWGSSYRGAMTIRECIARSANVCTVKKLTEITPALGYQYLTENFAFTTLPTTDIVQSTALGGITNGIYNLEMTAAYASIANKGVYTEPIFYTQIYDHDGNLLYENTPKTHVAMKETTAALMTDAMSDVVNSSIGTGGRAKFSGMPVVGKTGTTTGVVDLWFSGYTPYLTASVWTGYDDHSPMEKQIDNQSYHLVIWRKIMERIHEGYEEKSFEMPETVQRKTICTATGKLASTDFCSKKTEYFAEGTIPEQSCPGHPDKEKEAQEQSLQQQLQDLVNQGLDAILPGDQSNTITPTE